MRNKNLWLVMLLVFSIITSGFQAPVHAAEQTKQATITVIGPDSIEPIIETTVPFDEKATPTDLLIKAVGEDQVKFSETTYGKMLSGINGIEADGTNFWAFFANGISSYGDPSTYQVQNGDRITFRYTDWTKPIENTVTLEIVDSESKNIIQPASTGFFGSPNAFQLLQAILGPDQVEYEQFSFGKMIKSLQGVEADGVKNYWGFLVNGEPALSGAEDYQLKAGDVISFQLTAIEPLPATPGEEDNGTPNPTPSTPVATFPHETLQSAIDSVSQYALQSQVGEWEAIALKQAGKTIPAGYLESVKAAVKERQGKFSRITDTERYVLGILAAGGDPTNVEGYNLVEAIYNGNVTKQGLNGVAFALIALDSADFQVPASAIWTREKLIANMIENQKFDGGWEWADGLGSDIDLTAMILTSLAPYKDQDNVKGSVDKAVEFLKNQYQNSKVGNSNSAAQMIIALSALGVDANSTPFADQSSSLLQFFLSYQNSDGGFDFQGGNESDFVSTYQGIQALAAYQLFSQGKGSLYKFTLSPQNSVVNPQTETPKTDQTTEQTPGSKSSQTVGHTLPNTASDFGNLLAIGLLLILLGSGYYLKQRKSKA
jgi:LPXTG-motif cell wall-anchored protein